MRPYRPLRTLAACALVAAVTLATIAEAGAGSSFHAVRFAATLDGKQFGDFQGARNFTGDSGCFERSSSKRHEEYQFRSTRSVRVNAVVENGRLDGFQEEFPVRIKDTRTFESRSQEGGPGECAQSTKGTPANDCGERATNTNLQIEFTGRRAELTGNLPGPGLDLFENCPPAGEVFLWPSTAPVRIRSLLRDHRLTIGGSKKVSRPQSDATTQTTESTYVTWELRLRRLK